MIIKSLSVLFCVLSCVLSSCTIENCINIRYRYSNIKLSSPVCCDSSQTSDCIFPNVEFEEIIGVFPYNEDLFDEIIRQLDPHYTNKRIYSGSYTLTVKPGTCGYGELKVLERQIVVEGKCCGIIPYFSCKKDNTSVFYPESKAALKIIEYTANKSTDKPVLRLVKSFDIIAEERPLFKSKHNNIIVNQNQDQNMINFN
ncbi:hypothetical protein AYI70_g11586 [Smittium culicis]|uniref:Uncharacterized protein n=1 Tax=Smittium culicis TaxID=133412 RepID=A0A1R1X188_9FUNG|nr:hypothetical protein AYI70_g11586 [Smittium culicis]